MSNQPKNPYAFPRPYSVDDYGDRPQSMDAQEGMSLRDYFAAFAMQAIISTPRPFIIKETGKEIKEIYEIAEQAYELADAMLKASQS